MLMALNSANSLEPEIILPLPFMKTVFPPRFIPVLTVEPESFTVSELSVLLMMVFPALKSKMEITERASIKVFLNIIPPVGYGFVNIK
jgi:hypothetical protein